MRSDRSRFRQSIFPATRLAAKVFLDTSYFKVRQEHLSFVNRGSHVTRRASSTDHGRRLFDARRSSNDCRTSLFEARSGRSAPNDHRGYVRVCLKTTPSVGSEPVSRLALWCRRSPKNAVAGGIARERGGGGKSRVRLRTPRDPAGRSATSGISQSSFTARDTWVMGIGPSPGRSIRKRNPSAGSKNYCDSDAKRAVAPPKRSIARPSITPLWKHDSTKAGGAAIPEQRGSGNDSRSRIGPG